MRLKNARPLALAVVLFVAKSGIGQVPPSPRILGETAPKPDAQAALVEQARLAGLPAGSVPMTLDGPIAMRLALIRDRGAKPVRFETLDRAKIDEQVKGLEVDDFARFRSDLLKGLVIINPSADLLGLQARLLVIENAQRNLVYVEQSGQVIRELSKVEPTGLRQGDVDRIDDAIEEARRTLARETNAYRDGLDAMKASLGIALNAPVIVDASPLAGFREVFEASDRWFEDKARDINELDRVAGRLPSIGDVSIEGQPLLALIEREPDRLEEMLTLATRLAAKNRPERVDAEESDVRIRRRIRRLAEIRGDYEAERRASARLNRQMDGVHEQLIAPPNAVENTGQHPILSLVEFSRRRAANRDRLVLNWATFLSERLALENDLGELPSKDWAAYHGQFRAEASKPAQAIP